MSYIYYSDPHPGRCKNWRFGRGRCLDYEGTEHVCAFGEPEQTTFVSGAFTSCTYTWDAPLPVPWVRPENS